MAHVHSPVAFIVDEHGQATAVGRAFLAASQHQVDVTVTIGDETLHAIQSPSAVGILRGLKHHALQVAAGIGLGEVHRHTLAGTHAGNVLLTLLLAAELIECVDTALQRPNILETGIGSRNHLTEHGEHHIGQVQAAIAPRHGHAVQTGFAGCIQVFKCLAGINHAAVF